MLLWQSMQQEMTWTCSIESKQQLWI